jgi:hypothetical protein
MAHELLTGGDALVEGAIAVTARGSLRRVFCVAGRWFAEIECWPDGAGLFTAPLRAVRLDDTRPSPQPTSPSSAI